MARQPRLTLAGYPHHVIQRGNNRQPIFLDRLDFEKLRALIAGEAERFDVTLHAYVLMDNHFHLLATPATDDALPRWMQAVGRSYVRYFNDRHARTGSLWEGRYRSSLIQTERYLLACMVYLDLNPVRAGMVAAPRDYPWSSHGHYLGLRSERMLTPPAVYWELGNTPFAREAAYAELVQAGVDRDLQLRLTDAALYGWAMGDSEFAQLVQQRTGRAAVKGRPGRPPKGSSPGA
ncbi:MAG: transposase [Variovorax sp.]